MVQSTCGHIAAASNSSIRTNCAGVFESFILATGSRIATGFATTGSVASASEDEAGNATRISDAEEDCLRAFPLGGRPGLPLLAVFVLGVPVGVFRDEMGVVDAADGCETTPRLALFLRPGGRPRGGILCLNNGDKSEVKTTGIERVDRKGPSRGGSTRKLEAKKRCEVVLGRK